MAIHPLKQFREDHGLSQAELAHRLGVGRIMVTRWETRARRITDKHIPAIVRETGIPVSVLRPDFAALLEGAQ